MKFGKWMFAAVAAAAMGSRGGTVLTDDFVTEARAAYARPEYAAYTNSMMSAEKFRHAFGCADREGPGEIVRWITVDGTSNFRDIGGWNGLKTGRVIRGAEPNCQPREALKDPKTYHDLLLTPAGAKTLSETLGIRTDLDLRGRGESPTPDATPVPGARLVRIPCSSYTNFLRDAKTAAKLLRVFADAGNYPIYFHCYGGADRTGSLAFLLEGLCGASEADLCIDYELTSFSRIGWRSRAAKSYFYAAMVREMKTRPGATLRDKIESYVRNECGLSAEEVAAIRRQLDAAIHVAPGGSDANDGCAEKPVASFARALEIARKMRGGAQGAARRTAHDVIVIRLEKGVYPVDATIRLGPDDSNLRIVGAGEESVLSGGRKLPRFTVRPDGLWSVPVPPGQTFDILWLNGRRAQRAKMPNEGFFYMKRHCIPEEHNPYESFWADPENLKPLVGKGEDELKDVILRAYQSFATATSRPKRVTEDGLYTGSSIYLFPFFHWKQYHARYEIENLREALDAPGEWFLDRKANELLYIPRPGETPETVVAEVPVVTKLLSVAGDAKRKQPVRNVSFESLSLAMSDYGLPPTFRQWAQAASGLDAAIEVVHGENVRFTDVRMSRLGRHAVEFRDGCRCSGLEHCLVEESGASAVVIRDGDSLTVDNCILRAGGRIVPEACGVFLCTGSRCAITHCEICDFFYTGISAGWSWGYARTKTHDNLIGWNHIHHVGQRVFSDLGGIYTLGVSPGTRLVGNRIHDVVPYEFNIGQVGQGIYLDEGTSGVTVESNLIYNVGGAAMFLHYGETNLVRNNIFACAKDSLARRAQDERHLMLTLERNVFYTDTGTNAISGRTTKPGLAKNVRSRDNLYWSDAGFSPAGFMEADWSGWRAQGQDQGSLLADPKFADAAHRDFRLAPDSPAFSLGFRAWNLDDAGVSGDAAWVAKAKERTWRDAHVKAPAKYVIPNVNRLVTSFDNPAVPGFGSFGSTPDPVKGQGFFYSKSSPRSGTRCLEARDRTGSKYNFWPHLSTKVEADTHATARMALRTDSRTELKVSFRQYHPDKFREYVEGPCVTLAKNTLSACGRTLPVPENAWWTLTLTLDLDRRVWQVSVAPDGGAAQTLADLPFPKNDFRKIGWIGFMSTADADASWYLDDFSFEGDCAAVACGSRDARLVRAVPGALSPADALEKIRAARRQGVTGPWTVELAPGEHALERSLVLRPGDSDIRFVGTGDACLSGGLVLGGWRDDGRGVWSAPIPSSADGRPLWLEQLFVNGRRAARSRFPNAGAYKAASTTNFCPTVGKGGHWIERCVLTNDEVAAAFADVTPAQLAAAALCADVKWSYAKRILRGWNPQTRTVETHCKDPIPDFAPWDGYANYFFENLPAGFDAPGEWLYDVAAGRIRYRPLPGEDMRTAKAVAPRPGLSRLVEFKGEPDAGHLVSNVSFENVAFAYSGVTDSLASVPGGPAESIQYQSAYYHDGTVELEGATRVDFTSCRFRHTGNHGIRFKNGCRQASVRRCLFEDVGAGGIWIGAEDGYVTAEETPLWRRHITQLAPRATGFITVADCTLRAGGEFNPEGAGIVITHASDCRIEHCDISDFFYTGISVGWVWGYAGSVAQRNTVAFNRVHDLGKGRMSDLGGIYTLGTSYGTCVSNNVVFGIRPYEGGYGGWGLYTDQGSECIVMENNLVYDTYDGGFHQNFGSDNLIRNNIFAFNRKLGLVRTSRAFGHEQVRNTVHVCGNIVYGVGTPLVGEGFRKSWGVLACNLWYDAAPGARPLFDGLGWEDWKACGKEIGGVYGDPRFVDAERRDFRLRPDSPARRLGFREWDFSQAGVRLGP